MMNVEFAPSCMKKSHFARYVEEIEPDTYVEEFDMGFVKYRINSDSLYIADLYLIPEERGTGNAVAIADWLAKKASTLKLKYLTTTVGTSTKYATDNLRKYINYGFKVYQSDATFIYMFKEIDNE